MKEEPIPKSKSDEKPRTTKRRRRCALCSKIIEKGGKYYPTAGRKTGAYKDRAICIECHAEKVRRDRIYEKAKTQMKGLVF